MQNSKKSQKKKQIKCCLCDDYIPTDPITGFVYGNNPHPLGKKPDDRCCDICNAIYVLPARMNSLFSQNQST